MERAQLVAVRVTKIGEIQAAKATFTHPGRIFDRRAPILGPPLHPGALTPQSSRATHVSCLLPFRASGPRFPEAVAEHGGVDMAVILARGKEIFFITWS